MEPGFRDREYWITVPRVAFEALAAMEPGFRDREYLAAARLRELADAGCNGARF